MTLRENLYLIFSLALIFTGGCAPAKIASPVSVSRPSPPPISHEKEIAPTAEQSMVTAEPSEEGVTPEAMDSFYMADLVAQDKDDPFVSQLAEEEALPVEIQEEIPVEKVVEKVMTLPTVTKIDQRLAVYGEKQSSWEILDEQIKELELEGRRPDNWAGCYTRIQELFRSYSYMLEVALKLEHPSMQDENIFIDPWQISYQDISYLESSCEQVFMASASLVNGLIDKYSDSAARQSESIVGQYAGKGRYEEAIIAFQNLMTSYPDRDVSLQTKRMYGLALLKTGQFEAAGEVLDTILKEMAPSPDERTLRRLVADLLLASGHLEEAKAHYRRLADFFESRKGDDRWVADQLALLSDVQLNADELPMYMDVLQSYISFDGVNIPDGMREQVLRLEETFPDSPFSFRARQILAQTEDSARGWITSKMDRVDAYLQRRDFAEAKSILEMMLAGNLPANIRGTVQKAMDDTLIAEARDIEEEKMLLEQSFAEQWEKAVNFYESRQFDEAINAFSALFETDYDERAREKIAEASEKAAASLRRQAAGIFVKARKTVDYDRKKQLFKECWRLLSDITIKYPDVKLMSKVKQNIEILEKQIEMFDPDLLQELNGVPPEENSPDSFFGEEN